MSKRLPFDKLTHAQKRVRIARDVLKQLDQKLFKADRGRYLYFSAPDLTSPLLYERGSEIKPTLKKMELRDVFKAGRAKACEVCALGSLFVSAVQEADRFKLGEMDVSEGKCELGGSRIRQYLSEFFHPEQLDLMESYFERTSFAIANRSDDHVGKTDRAARAGLKYARPATRMRKIMENIIANKGEFSLDSL